MSYPARRQTSAECPFHEDTRPSRVHSPIRGNSQHARQPLQSQTAYTMGQLGLERLQRVQSYDPWRHGCPKVFAVKRPEGNHLKPLNFPVDGSARIARPRPRCAPRTPIIHDRQPKDILHHVPRPQALPQLVSSSTDNGSHLILHIQRHCRPKRWSGSRTGSRRSKPSWSRDRGPRNDNRGSSTVIADRKVVPCWRKRRSGYLHESTGVGGVVFACAFARG